MGGTPFWFADGVAGGTAVWREDISEIARLKHELAAAAIRLKEADRSLEHEKETKDEAASLRASEEIYDAMDREAGSWLREIQRLVAEPMPADKRRGLQEIRLLSIYIKRRCYFLCFTRSRPPSPPTRRLTPSASCWRLERPWGQKGPVRVADGKLDPVPAAVRLCVLRAAPSL